MTEEIIVTIEYPYSLADIKAQVTDEGGLVVWFYYRDIKQERHKITCTPEEWDRLMAWVNGNGKTRQLTRGRVRHG